MMRRKCTENSWIKYGSLLLGRQIRNAHVIIKAVNFTHNSGLKLLGWLGFATFLNEDYFLQWSFVTFSYLCENLLVELAN